MANSGTKKLLMLSYHFPPSGEVAGKPTARLVRYLKEFGWEPVVLTIGEGDIYGPVDRAGYADVLGGARVEAVHAWPYFCDGVAKLADVKRRVVGGVKGMLKRRGGGEAAGAVGGAGRVELRTDPKWKPGKMLLYSMYPDPQSGWVAPVVRHASRLMRRERFDAMFTVAPPPSVMVAGLALHRLHPEVPWLAQFHDPWAHNPFARQFGRVLDGWSARFERWVVRGADRVLLATDEAARAFAERYTEVPAGRFGVLANGYDPVDFPAVAEGSAGAAGGGPLRFIHTGTLYGGRNPFPFLRGLADLVGRGVIGRDEVRVEFIGDCAVADGKSVRGEVEAMGLGEVVTLTPPVSYPEALRRLSEADVLLLFAQQQPDQIPAKLYEYLHVNRYVLAFTEGASARVVNETGCGRVVGPEEDVAGAIAEVVRMHRSGGLAGFRAAEAKVKPYRAQPLAERLAGQLDEVVRARAAGGAAEVAPAATG